MEDLAESADDIVVEPTAEGVVADAGGQADGGNAVAAATTLPSPHTLEEEVPSVPTATPIQAAIIHNDGSETPVPPSSKVQEIDTDFANEVSPENDYDDDDIAAPVPDFTVAPHNLSGPQCQQILAAVANRLHAHIFNKCDFQLNSDIAYLNPGAVLEACYIGDIPGAAELIVSYDTLNETGGIMKHVPTFISRDAGDMTLPPGNIRGITSKDGTLPAFVFYVNIGGRLQKRALRAQSPVKYQPDGITLKPWSRDLRNGACISVMWRDVEKDSGISPILAKVVTQGGQDTKVELNPFDKAGKAAFSFQN